MKIIYDKADVNDITELTRFRLDYLEEDIGGVKEDERDIIEERLPIYYKEHLNKDFHVFVARDEDKADIVGCCFLLVTEKPANPNFISGLTGTVLNVYVKPEYRRRGIAKRMMEELISFAKESGLDNVELKSTDSGYELYRSLGFEDEVSKYHRMKIVLTQSEKSPTSKLRCRWGLCQTILSRGTSSD